MPNLSSDTLFHFTSSLVALQRGLPAKDLRQVVFNNLQGKYEYIMFITKPQNP